jgi:hypothetical protein
MKRVVAIGAVVLTTFVLVNYLEFHTWFYNNEMPAYLRVGVIHGDASGPLRAFYETADAACPSTHSNLVEHCRRYQLTVLADAPYVRPVSSAAGLLLTALSSHIEFMQALKLAIIALAMGGAILLGLLLLPFLAGLEGRALAAIGLVWVAGWIASRPLYVAGPGQNILLVMSALVVTILAAVSLRPRGMPLVAMKSLFTRQAWPGTKPAAKLVLQLLAIGLCFALGYRLHLLYESRFPVLYLLLAVGLWPLLHRALPDPGNMILSGFLAAVLYLSTTLVPSFYELTLAKQHQVSLVGIFLFIAIWRDDARVFWALPLLLLFDMQNGARLCALVVAGESLIGLRRRRLPTAILPAALTAVVGVTVTRTTAVYPFGERLFNVSDAVGVMTTPAVLTAGFVALAIVWATWDLRGRETASPLALDRMFIYGASIVIMAAIHAVTRGMLFDAFQLSNLFRAVAPAPVMAVFFATVGVLLAGCREGVNDVHRRSAIASLAALLLLMSTAKGRNVSLAQLSEGARASLGRYLPADWQRRTPYMTLHDNIVYYDAENLMSSPLMQYAVIKILLLSRNPEFSREKLTILPFRGR